MTDLVEVKQRTYAQLHALAAGADPADAYHADAEWRASHPFNEQVGLTAIGECWAALRRALPDLERRDSIFIAGQDRSAVATGDRVLVASNGLLPGNLRRRPRGHTGHQGCGSSALLRGARSSRRQGSPTRPSSSISST